MKRRANQRGNRKTLKQWVRRALRSWGSDASWGYIAKLQRHATPKTLALITTLSHSQSWRKRCLAYYVASQLRKKCADSPVCSKEFALPETQAMLLMGLHDPHPEVVKAAISGMGHRPHPDALPELVRLSQHADSQTRWNTAVALGHYAQPAATEALLCLARDVDNDVRDWATFALGTLQTVDTESVRELLWENINDPDSDVRGEALVGLAQRRDARVLAPLIACLEGDDCQVYALDAAELMADPVLLAPLENWATQPVQKGDSMYWRGRLDAAIQACSATPSS